MSDCPEIFVVICSDDAKILDEVYDGLSAACPSGGTILPSLRNCIAQIRRNTGNIAFEADADHQPPYAELDELAARCEVAVYFTDWRRDHFLIRWDNGWTSINNPALDAPQEFWSCIQGAGIYQVEPYNPARDLWSHCYELCPPCYYPKHFGAGDDPHTCKPYGISALSRETYEGGSGFRAVREFLSEEVGEGSFCLQGWSNVTGPTIGFDDPAQAALFKLRFYGSQH